MKKKHNPKSRKNLVILSIVLIAAVLAAILWRASAASGSITLSSSASSVAIGDSFVVTVNTVTDEPVTIAATSITYDKAALSVTSVDTSGSPYSADVPGENMVGDGVIKIGRYRAEEPLPNGTSMLAKITFKAIRDTGSVAIASVKADSVIYSRADASDILTSTGSTSVTLTGVPPTNNGGGGGGGSGGGGNQNSGGGGSGRTNTSGSGSNNTAPTNTSTPQENPVQPGQYGNQPSSVFETVDPNGQVANKAGVLSISGNRARAAIGVTVAILLGAAGYVGFALYRRRSFLYRKPSGAAAGAVVYDTTRHTPPASAQPNNIIHPDTTKPKE